MKPSSIDAREHRAPRGSVAPLTLLAGLFGVLYLVGPTRVFSYADDSVPFLLRVHDGSILIVHHVVLTLLGGLNRLLGFGGPRDLPKTLELLRVYVALCSVLGLSLVGILSRDWFGSRRVAVISMLFVAFTYGWWSYSIATDVYVPAVAFVLLAIFWAERYQRAQGPREVFVRLGLTALAILAAAVNHQSHSLVVIPIALVLLMGRSRDRSFRSRAARALGLVGLTGVLGLATYYSFYALSRHGGGFVHFLRGYTTWMTMSRYDGLQWKTPIYASIGIVRAVAYPEFSLRFDSVYAFLHRHFGIKFLYDEKFLLRDLPPALAALLLVAVALVSLAVLGIVLRSIVVLRRRPQTPPGVWMLVGWTLVQAIFFASWEPTSNEFWIWLLPVIGLLGVGLAVPRGGRGPTIFVSVLLGLMLLATTSVVSRYWSARNCVYQVNKTFFARVRPEDLVISADSYPSTYLDPLFAPAAHVHRPLQWAFVMTDSTVAELDRVRARKGRVILDPALAMPEDTDRQIMTFTTHLPADSVDRELLRLESYCRENQLPLLAVERIGSEELRFEPRRFAGWARWVGADLRPAPPPR